MALSLRIKKQLIYGSIFVLIIAGIGVGIYFLFLVPEPNCFDNIQNQSETGLDCGGMCIDCELKNIKPIAILRKEATRATTTKTSLLLEFENVNQTYGVAELPFVIKLNAANGEQLKEIKRQTSLLPKEKKYITEIALDIPYEQIVEIKVELGQFEWRKGDEITVPKLEAKQVQVKIQGKQVTLEGIIENKSAEGFEKISIVGMLRNSDKEILGFSKTELGGVTGFSEAPFKIFMPDLGGKLQAIDKSASLVNIEPVR